MTEKTLAKASEPDNKEVLQALLRKLLTVIGTVLVYKGWIPAELLDGAVNALAEVGLGIISILISSWLSYRSVKKLKKRIYQKR